MASAASGQGQVIRKADVKGMRGKDLQKFLDQALAEGRGLSPGLVTSLNNRQTDYESRDQTVLRHAGMDGERGLFSGSLAGAKGAKLPSGDYAYYGSTAVTEPGKSGRSVNGGWTSTKERTTHIPIVMPTRAFGSQQQSAAAPAQEKAPLEPGQDLIAAREAYDRAKAYMDQGSSAASGGPDLSKTGGDLMNEIFRYGDQQAQDYERRFLPYLDAKANLTGQEVGFAARQAINDLPDDLNLPEYSQIFNEEKIAQRGGIYPYISKQIS